MAALIGLDDERLPELVERASTYGVFGVANRNSPGQVVVSGERAAVEAALVIAKELGAQAVDAAAGVGRGPFAADGRCRQRACATVLANVHVARSPTRRCSRTPAPAASTTAETAPRGARGSPDDGRGLGGRASSAMTAAGVDTFIEVGPGRVLTGLIKRIAPDARAMRASTTRLRTRRPPRAVPIRATAPAAGRLTGPVPPDRPPTALARRRNPVRKPDYNRRVVVTGLGVVSPVGNDHETAWDNLIHGRSGLGEITHFDISRYEHKAGGEVKEFEPTQWLDAKAVRRSEQLAAVRGRGGKAGRD